MSSDNESVIFLLCGCGIRGADLVRYGAIQLPTSIGECNNPSILFSFRYLASEGSE